MPSSAQTLLIRELEHARRLHEERRAARERQIALIGQTGRALDRYLRTPFVRTTLTLMRKPARAAGFSALQDFLERGFASFASMHGADEFLATVDARETALMEEI